MNEWQTIIAALVPVFGMVIVGIIVRRLGWLTEEADRSLIHLCVRLLFPCLIIRAMTTGDWFRQSTDLIIPPFVGFGLTFLGFVVSAIFVYLLGEKIGLKSKAQQHTFVFCVGMFNYGYIPIPLVVELYPGDSVTMSTLLLHNVGVDTAMWTLGPIILMGKLGKQWWRGILNPVVLSIIAAVIMKLVIGPYMTAHPIAYQWEIINPIAKVVGYMADCAIPLSLVITGATIADVWRDADLKDELPTTIAGCLLRLGILPLMFLAIARLIPFEVGLTRVIAIQAAMPAAIFPIVLAKHYNGDAPTAVRIVLSTHFLCLLTTVLWLMVGLH